MTIDISASKKGLEGLAGGQKLDDQRRGLSK